jgi:hypothetical protein
MTYEQEYQNQVQYLLGKLDGKVDTLLSNQTVWISRVEDTEKRVTHNDKRITALETRADETKSNKAALIAVISVAISVVVAGFNIAKTWLLK